MWEEIIEREDRLNLKEQIEEILEDKLLVKIIEKVKKPFIKAILGNESSDIPFGAELEETITDILKAFVDELDKAQNKYGLKSGCWKAIEDMKERIG